MDRFHPSTLITHIQIFTFQPYEPELFYVFLYILQVCVCVCVCVCIYFTFYFYTQTLVDARAQHDWDIWQAEPTAIALSFCLSENNKKNTLALHIYLSAFKGGHQQAGRKRDKGSAGWKAGTLKWWGSLLLRGLKASPLLAAKTWWNRPGWFDKICSVIWKNRRRRRKKTCMC